MAPTNRKRLTRNCFRITPEIIELYKTAVANWDHWQGCAELDYPQECGQHEICREYLDVRDRLWPLLGQTPYEACPIQPWSRLIWDRHNVRMITLKKALDEAAGVSLPPDLDEQITRVNDDISQNGRQGRY